MKSYFAFPILAVFILSSCAHQEIAAVKVIAPPLVHNLYVAMPFKGKKNAVLPEELLRVQLDQNCSYQFEGQLKEETLKIFRTPTQVYAVGACVTKDRQLKVTGDSNVLAIYGKYRIHGSELSQSHKVGMMDLLCQKCSLKYQGKLIDNNLLTWNQDSDGTYVLGECQLPPKGRGISSFDTVPDGEKSF